MNEQPPKEEDKKEKEIPAKQVPHVPENLPVEETKQENLDRKAREAERIEKIKQEESSQKRNESHPINSNTSVLNNHNEGSNSHKESGHPKHSGHGEPEKPLTKKEKFFKGLKSISKGVFGNFFFGFIVAMKLGWEKATGGGKSGGGGGHSAPKKSSGGGHH